MVWRARQRAVWPAPTTPGRCREVLVSAAASARQAFWVRMAGRAATVCATTSWFRCRSATPSPSLSS
eukprot:614103-Rhodomonas_salina.1